MRTLAPTHDQRVFFTEEHSEFQSVGPKDGNSFSNTSGSNSVGYASVFYGLLGTIQFLLILYAVATCTLGLVDFINANNLHCAPESCVNGDVGPQGDNGTCVGQCFNGINGTNGTSGLNYTRPSNFGQWNFNAISAGSPYLPGFTMDSGLAGVWVPISTVSSGSNGFFSTDNSGIFSSSGTGLNVRYNGPNNGWVTVSWDIQVYRTSPYVSDLSFYEVTWLDPNTAPFVATSPKIDNSIQTNGAFKWWSVSSTVKMKLPTGAILKAYSIFPTEAHIFYIVKSFNLLIVLD